MEPSYFDGIDNVFIHFDDKDGLFEGGQKLSGKINVLVKETTRIRDIKLYVTARLRIKWIDVEGGANVNFEELDFPINETIIIHEMNRNDEYSKWLFPGEKTFRFSYRLEATLPYSLEGKYGTIAYKAKAVVMIANGKTSESMEEDFFVRSRPLQLEENLLTMASLKAPLENVEYGKVGSGCFSTAKRNIEIGIKIQKPIFKQGEKIRPEVQLSVEKRGGGSVEGLLVLLVQEIIFTCNLGEDDERMKKEVIVVGEWKTDKGTEGGDTNKFDDIEILIAKDLPVTGFPHTELIDVSYFLHAVAKTPKRDDDIIVKLPVIIMFGNEDDWSEEEKLRLIGDGDAFGKGDSLDETFYKGPEVDNTYDKTLVDTDIPESENQRDDDDNDEDDSNDVAEDGDEEVDTM